MNKAFGHEFIIVNDVIQKLDPKVFQNGPWYHIATVRRGLREYMAFARLKSESKNPWKDFHQAEVYIEIIDPHTVALSKIEDDAEWEDVVRFLQDAKLLEIGNRRETHIDETLIFKNKK